MDRLRGTNSRILDSTKKIKIGGGFGEGQMRFRRTRWTLALVILNANERQACLGNDKASNGTCQIHKTRHKRKKSFDLWSNFAHKRRRGRMNPTSSSLF